MIELLKRLGYKQQHKRWGPCPACGSASTKKDRRPPLRVKQDLWTCSACQRGGDALQFAANHLGLESPRGKNFWRAKELLGEDVEQVLEHEYEPEAPPDRGCGSLIREYLASARPVEACDDGQLAAFLEARSLNRSIPAGVSDGTTSFSFWPRPMAEQYRLLVPTCDSSGVVQSFQGVDMATSLKRWPKGIDNRGLIFAARKTRTMLRDGSRFNELLIVEGVIDFLTAAIMWDVPLIGIFPGSDYALQDIKLTDDAVVVFGTHLDSGAGLSYQDRVSSILRHPVRRMPFEATE